jgi:hypothetical protein
MVRRQRGGVRRAHGAWRMARGGLFARRCHRCRNTRAMQMPDLVGWIASAILLATLARQTWRQWREPDPRGVSRWLVLGQIAASVGFVAYSWMLGNWVFIVTNTLILLTAVVGQLALSRARRDADPDQ